MSPIRLATARHLNCYAFLQAEARIPITAKA